MHGALSCSNLPQSPQLTVHPSPSVCPPCLIWAGGTQIREIRDRTGARVRVGNDKIPGTNDRPVTIWGDPTQVKAAEGR